MFPTSNKDSNATQYTIVWHIDDLRIFHIVTSLSIGYGKVSEIMVRREMKQDYLGTILDFLEDGKFTFDMEEILCGLLEGAKGVATTPTYDHLFKMCNDMPKLAREREPSCSAASPQIIFVV